MVNQIEEEGRDLPPDMPRSVTPDVAASNPDVIAIIQPRLIMLMDVANRFLETIMQSLDQVPYGIRWICKQIRSLTKRKYPEATDIAICSLIGGFFFLRFLNPAIVTPQAYMLVDRLPGKHPRTTLTLVSGRSNFTNIVLSFLAHRSCSIQIAKMLQNLANKPSYAKETYMIPTNPFVEKNKQRINRFLNDLCEVGDFYESLEMDQYMALSKKDIVLNITLNEIYNTHALLQQHIDVLAPKKDDHLRILLTEAGSAPAQVPRKQNLPIVLPLFSRWETPIQGKPMATSPCVATIMMMKKWAIVF